MNPTSLDLFLRDGIIHPNGSPPRKVIEWSSSSSGAYLESCPVCGTDLVGVHIRSDTAITCEFNPDDQLLYFACCSRFVPVGEIIEPSTLKLSSPVSLQEQIKLDRRDIASSSWLRNPPEFHPVIMWELLRDIDVCEGCGNTIKPCQPRISHEMAHYPYSSEITTFATHRNGDCESAMRMSLDDSGYFYCDSCGRWISEEAMVDHHMETAFVRNEEMCLKCYWGFVLEDNMFDIRFWFKTPSLQGFDNAIIDYDILKEAGYRRVNIALTSDNPLSFSVRYVIDDIDRHVPVRLPTTRAFQYAHLLHYLMMWMTSCGWDVLLELPHNTGSQPEEYRRWTSVQRRVWARYGSPLPEECDVYGRKA